MIVQRIIAAVTGLLWVAGLIAWAMAEVRHV